MTAIHSLILGVVQGLTEFLPVSSTAHLTFVETLFKYPSDLRVSYDVWLHLGTALALVIFFFRRIVQIIGGLFSTDPATQRTNWNLVLVIFVGTIPAAIAGYLVKDKIDVLFARVVYSALTLLITGTVLFLTKWTKGERQTVSWRDGLVIGIAQAAAVLHIMSRSGATVSAALFLGLARSEAFEFSFLLSIPAMAGAALLKLKDSHLLHSGGIPLTSVAIGFVASCAVGLLALALVRKILLQKRFWWFSIYCWAVGIAVLAVRYLGQR